MLHIPHILLQDRRKLYGEDYWVEIPFSKLLIGEHPEQVDVKRIKGKRNDYYRIRLGSYRIVCAIVNGKIVCINTILAGSRGDVYKENERFKMRAGWTGENRKPCSG